MRLTIRSGDQHVTLRAKGRPTTKTVRAMEKTARRLFATLPEPTHAAADDQPFGFALSSDLERAPDPYDDPEEDE